MHPSRASEISAAGITQQPETAIHALERPAVGCNEVVEHERSEGCWAATAARRHVALLGEISFKHGAAEQDNYDTFSLPRIDESAREVRPHILPSEELPAVVGETGTSPIAPAVCNAIFAATDKRVREPPIRKHDLS